MKRSPPFHSILVLLALELTGVLSAACGAPEEGTDTATPADTLTRRQKDSVISTLPLPGAGAVGRALEASDRARERARAHDTIR